jgi:hypothetical protein
MISLVVMILCGWLLYRMLAPRMSAPLYIEPPPPQVVIHLHLIVPVKEQSPIRAGGDTRSGAGETVRLKAIVHP